MLSFACVRCAATFPADPSCWRCSACGGPLEIPTDPTLASTSSGPRRDPFPPERLLFAPEADPVTLGEGETPLIPGEIAGRPVRFKCEHLSPTGSFKDRGASVLVTWLKARNVGRVVEDSSGNAGIALAAYAARGGIEARIFVPEGTSPAKTRLIEMYGASLVRVPGGREAAAKAAREAARDCVYASHVHQPHFLQGMKSLAHEIRDECGDEPPACIAVPVGNGSLVLGLDRGFRETSPVPENRPAPRILGYQSEQCAPLALAFEAGAGAPLPVETSPTRAEGIAVAAPPRGVEILAAVRRSGGWIGTVSEVSTGRARERLARAGLLVEWTSAVAVAGLENDLKRREIPGPIVVVLTAAGFKDPETFVPRGSA